MRRVGIPPKCSPAWTVEERALLAAFMARMLVVRIDGGDPAVPLLVKKPARDMFWWIQFVLTAPAQDLEAKRPVLERVYDARDDQPGAWVLLPPGV